MNRVVIGLISAVLLTACGASKPVDTGEVEQITLFEKDAKDVVIPSGFGSSRIQSWRVVDDSTMIIKALGHGELVATFTMPCRGIRYADTLGFATMGPFELDRTTRVILPDGTRCHFRELKPLIKLEDSPADDQ